MGSVRNNFEGKGRESMAFVEDSVRNGIKWRRHNCEN